jgi:hypothetical protein
MALKFTVKKWFFSEKIVQAMVDQRTGRALTLAGQWIRNAAKWSMAERANRDLHSPPGTPPYAHPKTGKALKKHIYYHYSPTLRTVVVGPVPLGYVGDVPRIHEFGFTGTRRLRNRRRRIRKLGGAGEIRLTTMSVTRYADSPTGRDAVALQDTSTKAVYAHLRTPAQVRRSNELNEALYGPLWMLKPVSFPPRPYMRPALAAAKPMLPKFWATSVAAPAAA